ncbi:protein EMBRYONIC FLOWER 1 [Forsythia ovata]|uniref:Protein EMBRYONIC FLOWER 1 n=1 Tax=Forsythia ovata TaxID=205694 RepID=A0ABD1W5K5_9LAMI
MEKAIGIGCPHFQPVSYCPKTKDEIGHGLVSEMDKSIVALEENRVRSNSAASASKSLRSLVQINSIAVDLSIPVEEIEIPAHGHFSIRGYVAEIRKKDRKHCFPFASEVGNGVLEDNLAPLYVPKFRWWQCLNCTAESTTQETIPAHRRNVRRSACVKGGEKDRSSSHSDNVTNTEVRDRTILGNKHGHGDFGGAENNNPINNIPKFNPCPNEETATGSKNGADFRDKEHDNPSFYVTQATPLHIREKDTNASDSIDHRERNVPKPNNWMIDDGDICPQVEIQSDTVNSGIACVTGLPSHKVSEPDNLSSESDDNSSGLPHRRKPKLRYLDDILEAGKGSLSGPPRISRASSNGMHVASAKCGVVLAPQHAADFPEDVQKRKIPHEEDRIPEISDSKSEGDDFTKLDFRLGTKTQWIKTRKRKILDSRKKKRPIHIDDGTTPAREVPKINTVDLHKHAVIDDTSFCKLADIPSTLGQKRIFFRSFQSEQHMERNSSLSNKRPEVEADQNTFMPPSNIILGESNINGKVALNLSLNNFMDVERTSNEQTSFIQQRGVPGKNPQRKLLPLDLNKTFTPKMGEELPTLLENGSLTLHDTLDISASYMNEKAREGQGPGVSGPENNQQTGERSELGPSDDIPMEIVELMAKNQHERALGNSRKFVLHEGSNRTTRESPALHGNGHPIVTNFLLANTGGSSVNRESDNIRGDQSNHNHFAWLSRNQFNTGKLEESSFFNSFLQNQQSNTPFSASGSNITGSRLWEGAEPLWSSSKENVPFHLPIPKNCSTQSNNTRTHSFVDPQHKGKTISDIKGHEEKLAVHDMSLLKQGRIGPSPKSVGSLDPYSNDTIPAMQLLSLMNQGVISSYSFNVGTESFLL